MKNQNKAAPESGVSPQQPNEIAFCDMGYKMIALSLFLQRRRPIQYFYA